MRQAGVRLQLDRDGHSTSYSADSVVDEASVLAQAPDLDIAGNRVRLEGSTYRMTLALPGLDGEIALDPAAQRSMPPATIRGAGGWVSGYVVPALSGTMRGTLRDRRRSAHVRRRRRLSRSQLGILGRRPLAVGSGGARRCVDRVRPRVSTSRRGGRRRESPDFLRCSARDGLLGFSTNVAIDDATEGRVDVRATRGLDLHLTLSVDETVRSTMG